MKKDWLSLTRVEIATIKPQIKSVVLKIEHGDSGPLNLELTNSTTMHYQTSRFNPHAAKWFNRPYAKKLAKELNVPFKEV